MWSLRHSESGREWTVGGLETTVGRGSGGGLQLAGDSSVSRRHALLLQRVGRLLLRDLGSRYGSWLQTEGVWTRLTPDDDRALQSGDLVRFGGLNNVWLVQRHQLRICFSTATPDSALNDTLHALGATIAEDWTADCTHLTMPSITLTLKVVGALVHCKPIVTLDFWKTCLCCLEGGLSLPNPLDFLPPVNESTLNRQTANFSPDVSRSGIFKGKKIIFLSRNQSAKYKHIIESAGGESHLLSDCKMSKLQLCEPKCIIVQPLSSEQSQSSQMRQDKVKEVIDILSKKKLRLVPEAEIGLAILFCSLDKYCNPSFSFAANIINFDAPTTQRLEVLAPETQDNSPDFFSAGSDRSEVVADIPSSSEVVADIQLISKTVDGNSKMKPPDRPLRPCKTTRMSSDEEGPPRKIKANETRSGKFSNRTETEESQDFFEKNTDVDHRNNKRPLFFDDDEILIRGRNKLKKYNDELPLDDENLFNFISDTSTTLPSKPKTLKHNIDAAVKRIFLDDDDPPETNFTIKESPVSSSKNTTSNSNTSFNESRWISKLEPSTLISVKREIVNIDDEGLEKEFKNIQLQPAVIVINNNLIKKIENKNVNLDTSITKINFKKFIKVLPLKSPSSIISRNKLTIYESVSSKSSKILEKSYSDDDDDNGSLFNMPDHRTKFSNYKTGKIR